MPLQPWACGGQSEAIVHGTVQKPPPLAGKSAQSIEVQSESAAHIDPKAPAAASRSIESPRPPPSPQPLQWSLSGSVDESSLGALLSPPPLVPVSAVEASPPEAQAHAPKTPLLPHVSVPDAPFEQVHACWEPAGHPLLPELLLLLQATATRGTRNMAAAMRERT
jgi:hypothetical protein